MNKNTDIISNKIYIWITSQPFSDAYGWSKNHDSIMDKSDNPWLDNHIRGEEGCLSKKEVIEKIKASLLL